MKSDSNRIQWLRTSEVIQQFITRYGQSTPRRAILCTYDLDIESLDRHIFPLLDRPRRSFNTLILADANALRAHERSTGSGRFGRAQIAPVRCHRGVFHPKLLILRAGPHTLVGIGSANLTRGGFGGNLELMLIEDNHNEAGQSLACGAALFLTKLAHHDYVRVPQSAAEFIRMVVGDLSENNKSHPRNSTPLLHSLEEPLIDQLYDETKEFGAKHIDIISPWHSAGESEDGMDPSIISAFSRHYKAAEITIHTQGQGGKAPQLGKGVEVRIRGHEAEEYTQEGEEEVSEEPEKLHMPTRVHAKAYIFSRQNNAVMYFGSANCTEPALRKKLGAGGNVELLVGTKLNRELLKAWKEELSLLFVKPTGTIKVTRPKRNTSSLGKVLCGVVSGDATTRRLKLELTSKFSGKILLAQKPHTRGIPIDCKGLSADVDSTSLLKLLPRDWFEQEECLGGMFLYEQIGSNEWVPFPVSLPLTGMSNDGPIDGLKNLLLEELGLWRPKVRSPKRAPDNWREQIDKEDPEEQDTLLTELTRVKHQGKLDQLAVMVALLRKRMQGLGPDNEYACARIAHIVEQMHAFGVEPHLLEEVSRYLAKPMKNRQRNRKKT